MNAILAALYLQGGLALAPGAAYSPPGYFDPYDINQVRNPYGTAALGFDHDAGRWHFELQAHHMSSLAVDAAHGHQTGINALEFNVRLHPFGSGG